MLRRVLSSTAFVIAAFAAGAAAAAPYCVVTGARANCTYDTADHCQSVAIARRGDCVANPDPSRKSFTTRIEASSYGTGNVSLNFSGNAPYCAVTPTSQRCAFYAEDACGVQAQAEGGVCIINPNRR